MNILWFYIDSVKGHPTFKTGKEIWQEMETSVTAGDISIDFLVLVKQYENKLPFIFANLPVNRSEVDVQTNVKRYINRITELAEIEQKGRQNILLLESAIEFAKKLSWNSGQIALGFKLRRESLSKTKLSNLNEKNWRPYIPVLQLSACLQLVMQSFSFRIVANVCLRENSDKSLTVLDSDHRETNR